MKKFIYNITVCLLYLVSFQQTGNASQNSEKHTVLVVMAYFLDNQPSDRTSVDEVTAAMEKIRKYYLNTSYGKIDFGGKIDPSKPADIFDWIQLSVNSDTSKIRSEALKALKERGVEVNGYDKYVVIANYSSLPTAGHTIGGDAVVIRPHANLFKVGAHEIGHLFGNGHADFLDCYSSPLYYFTASCLKVELADNYDPMGTSPLWDPFHLNAVHMDISGFFSKSNLIDLTDLGTYTVTIEPLETPTDGPKAVRLRRPDGDDLYIEYRQPIGNDAITEVDHDVFQGALIHLKNGNKSWLLDMTAPSEYGVKTPTLHPGKSFRDPKTNNLIHVDSMVPGENGSLTMTITVNEEYVKPTIYFSKPLNNSKVNGNIKIKAISKDNRGINTVKFFLGDNSNPNKLVETQIGSRPTDTYELELNTSSLHNGRWYIKAIAQDLSGHESHAALLSFEVANDSDTTPPTVNLIQPIMGSTSNGQQIEFIAKVIDDQSIWKVEYYLDNNIWKPNFEGKENIPNTFSTQEELSTGPHKVMVRAYDLQGNVSESEWIHFNVVNNVDVTGPKVLFSSPTSEVIESMPCQGTLASKPGYNGAIDFKAHVYDYSNVGPVSFTMDQTLHLGTLENDPYQVSWTSSNLRGTHTLKASLTDSFGNSSIDDCFRFDINQSPILNPIENQVIEKGEERIFEVSATVPDYDPSNFTIEVTPKGTEQFYGIFNKSRYLADILWSDRAPQGRWKVRVTVEDQFGNGSSKVFDVRVNGQDPDDDKDGWPNHSDNCPDDPNGYQEDFDQDGLGDACDIHPPQFGENLLNIKHLTTDFGKQLIIGVPAYDLNGDRLSFSYTVDSQSPPGVIFLPFFGSNTYAMVWPALTSSSWDVTFRVTDPQGLNDTHTIKITVLAPDTDGDGVLDDKDNCTLEPNSNQLDTDGDNYGNACDPDFDNNGVVDNWDFDLFKPCFGHYVSDRPDCSTTDLNGDGAVGIPDFIIFRTYYQSDSAKPGPTGLITEMN